MAKEEEAVAGAVAEGDDGAERDPYPPMLNVDGAREVTDGPVDAEAWTVN